MIVFSTFFKVLKRYSVSIIMYLGISIGIIFILSSFSNGGNSVYESISQGLVIVDKDESDLSKKLIEYLDSVNTIKTESFTEDQITDMMYYTRISNYLEIPSGFSKAFSEYVGDIASEGKSYKLIDSTKNFSARMGYSVEAEIDGYLNLIAGYLRGGYSLDEAHKLASDSLTAEDSVKMVAEVKIEDDKLFTVFQMIPYGILTMLFSAVLPVILRFGTVLIRKRSGISPTPNSKRSILLACAAGVVSMLVILVLIIIASILSGEAFSTRWWLIVLNLIVFSLTAVMLLVAISNFNVKPESAPGITNVIALSFSFLGGIFVPMEVLGGAAKVIGQFLPTYWYSEALLRVKNGGNFSDILNCLLIQLLFGVMVMGVGLVIGKYTEKKN